MERTKRSRIGFALFINLLMITSLISKNIYFGPRQLVSTFEEAFIIAETGDHLIEARIDTIRFDNGHKWLSFPALDILDYESTYDPDRVKYLIFDLFSPFSDSKLNNVTSEEGSFVWKISSIWQGTNNIFSRTDGYKFQMNSAYDLDVCGFKEPDNTSITINGNNTENWIGYWLDETQHVSDAFSGYWNGSNIYYIQHQDWTAVFRNDEWAYKMTNVGQPTISYGEMVIVKCENTINNFSWDNTTPEEEKSICPETEQFSYLEQADYTPIFIELNETDLPQEIGAFVNDVCIGATVVERSLAQINAYTDANSLGDVEFEMYYGSRSANRSKTEYVCESFEQPGVSNRQINTNINTDAWFVSFKDDSSLIPVPEKVSISNYPNPFNPNTTISYSLPIEGEVSIKVYNTKGQQVKQLVNGTQPEGYYDVVWDGKDEAGRKAASGIYYYQIKACGKTINKKMLMLK